MHLPTKSRPENNNKHTSHYEALQNSFMVQLENSSNLKFKLKKHFKFYPSKVVPPTFLPFLQGYAPKWLLHFL